MEDLNVEEQYRLTPRGWEVVQEVRSRYHLQRAASTTVVVRVANLPIPEESSEQASPEQAVKINPFINEKGFRTKEGRTLEVYLLALAELHDRGISPTKAEWGMKVGELKGTKAVTSQGVSEACQKLIAHGLVEVVTRVGTQEHKSTLITETGREWLSRLSGFADISSIMSRLMESGKISADDLIQDTSPSNPNAKQEVLKILEGTVQDLSSDEPEEAVPA